MKVLLSIRPEFAEKIFNKTKKFEFRKSIYANRSVQTVVVYATQPMARIIGEFDVDGISEATPDNLWAATKLHAGISREYFDTYFMGRMRAYAIHIGKVRKYANPLMPHDLIGNFTAPQSYMYVNDELTRPTSSEYQTDFLSNL